MAPRPRSRGAAAALAGLLCPVGAAGQGGGHEVVLDDVRVQALSPTLLRVEPRGPRGFEDRSTFAVVERAGWGVPLRLADAPGDDTVVFATAHYSVVLRRRARRRELETEAPLPSFRVVSKDGEVLFESDDGPEVDANLLQWPAPLENKSYALVDRPRFVAPEWGFGPVPSGAHVDPELHNTHGFDFRNNVAGDTYVFLLGDTLQDWTASRGEFLKLTGPTPIIPDYAYGTWYTSWIPYTQQLAESEIELWDAGRFPLDIWGLDLNWRLVGPPKYCLNMKNTSSACLDHFYDHPNTKLFPDFQGWFDFLHERGLHTYLNDHPFPQDVQLTEKEVDFRWAGLTGWMKRGVDFWWYDHNWGFCVPPPMRARDDGSPWQGLTSQVWGSYMYSDIAKRVRSSQGDKQPPLTLSRDNGPWMTPQGTPATAAAAVPAHHRFPVWWTGDSVQLNASVEAMVDQGMHHFRPFTHSDCGGHQGNATQPGAESALMRWTAFCSFGTILRYHQGEHRFWLYSNSTQDVVRRYLETRYRLLPSLISAGKELQQEGFPLVARCDFNWPEHQEARNNSQYLFLNDTLVAPLGEQDTTRRVWIPPGQWQDAWDGSLLSGPQSLWATQPWSRIPMWHRRGSLLVTGPAATRVSQQNRSQLTIEAFPAEEESRSARRLDMGEGQRAEVTLVTLAPGRVRVTISPDKGVVISWLLRLHLLPGQRAELAALTAEGSERKASVEHLLPGPDCERQHFPFGGAGTRPACLAGPVAEVVLPGVASDFVVDMAIVSVSPEADALVI